MDFNSILGEQEVDSLFSDVEETTTQEQGVDPGKENPDETKNNETNGTTEVVDSNDLFGGDIPEEKQPESVGRGNTEEKKGDTVPDKGSDTSPNLYSSIANACAVDGIFPNSDDETIKKVDSAEAFSDLISAEIEARLDDAQRRVLKALENGVEPNDIRMYENTLNNLSKITDAQISEESEQGQNIRKELIYRDFLNKGYSHERALKLTERSIDAGTDVEDAKDALQGNKDFFQNQYNKLLEDAQEEAKKDKAERQKQEANLKKSILEDKQLMGDLEISQELRKRVYDNITKPVYKDPETGEYMTSLQKYEVENRADFIKYVGLIYTMTDGFKDFESFTKGKVKKEVRKGLRDLEQVLNNTKRDPSGALNLVGGGKDDPESFLGGGFKLAL